MQVKWEESIRVGYSKRKNWNLYRPIAIFTVTNCRRPLIHITEYGQRENSSTHYVNYIYYI